MTYWKNIMLFETQENNFQIEIATWKVGHMVM